MKRYFTHSLRTSICTVLFLMLLVSCKDNGTGLQPSALEITNNPSFSVEENQTTVATMTVEGGDNLTFAITGGADADLFAIDESGGALTFNTAPDFENPADADSDNTYELTIEASADEASASQEVTVTVNDVDEDEAPAITSENTFSVEENMTAVDTVTATDPNDDPVTFSITGGVDQDQFSIDGSSGVLTFDSAPDYENPTDADTDNTYRVEVEASDGEHSVSQSLTVTVADVSENGSPTITSDANFEVEENQTSVGTITASDPDEGDSITFSITDGVDQNQFSIEESSGVLTFNTAPDYENPTDADTDNTYRVEVEASDGQHSVSQNLTVTVIDVNENEAPAITSSANFEVEEGTTAVGTVTATDPEGDAITYSISGGVDAGSFSIDTSSGELAFNSAPDFENPGDADGDNVYEVEVQASDGSQAATQALSVTVTDDGNQAPIFTNATNNTKSYEIKEGPDGGAINTIYASDPEDDEITFSITGGVDAGSFSLNPNGENSTAFNIDIATDYDNPTDANGDNIYEVQVQASDGDRTTTLSITVEVVSSVGGGGIYY